MRKIWIREIYESQWKSKIMIIFFIAYSDSENDSKGLFSSLFNESQQFRDLLVFKLNDHYRMSTWKILNFIRYCLLIYYSPNLEAQNCNQMLPIIAKMDEDIVVFPDILIKIIEYLSHFSGQRFCAGQSSPSDYYKITRLKNEPQYIPYAVYSQNEIPSHYLTGFCYFISYPAAIDLYRYAKCMENLIFVDDYLITGFIRDKLKIPLIHLDNLVSPVKDFSNIAIVHGYPSFFLHNQKLVWNSARGSHGAVA